MKLKTKSQMADYKHVDYRESSLNVLLLIAIIKETSSGKQYKIVCMRVVLVIFMSTLYNLKSSGWKESQFRKCPYSYGRSSCRPQVIRIISFWFCFCLFVFCETGFLCVVLALLELTL